REQDRRRHLGVLEGRRAWPRHRNRSIREYPDCRAEEEKISGKCYGETLRLHTWTTDGRNSAYCPKAPDRKQHGAGGTKRSRLLPESLALHHDLPKEFVSRPVSSGRKPSRCAWLRQRLHSRVSRPTLDISFGVGNC